MPSFLEAAIEAAKKSGANQLKYVNSSLQVEYKGEINLVTQVDKECEQIVASHLQGLFPDHDFLAEEGGGKRTHSDYKWIVDPLDGTTNYTHGYPLFCTSIALEHKGEIIVGVVYEPNRDELFYAEKGKGSFLNGRPLRVSTVGHIKQALLATGFAYNIHKTENNNIDHFGRMLMQAQAIRRDGVAAIDLCYVACGRYDGYWELGLFPWDVAAGVLILEEAGGQVSPFAPGDFSVYGKEILASNAKIHSQIQEVLKTK